jgi:hypothetical protein
LHRHPWCGELLLLAALYSVYELVRAVTHTGLAQSLHNGRDILSFEQHVHLAPEHALNSFFAAVPAIAIPACFLYATCHYVITPVVLIWVWRAHPDQYRRVRSVLIVGTLVALIGFWLLPTAPPRSIGGFTDTMAHWSGIGWWGTDASVPQGLEGLTDQAGAMPSLHVGWALWCGWAIVRCARHRWVRVLGAAYPVVIVLVVLGTANHYLADAVAGSAVIGLGMLLVAAIGRIQERHLAGRLIRTARVAGENRALGDDHGPLAAGQLPELSEQTPRSEPASLKPPETPNRGKDRTCLLARNSFASRLSSDEMARRAHHSGANRAPTRRATLAMLTGPLLWWPSRQAPTSAAARDRR